MTPIALYPSDASLKKAVALGLFLFFIAYLYLTWSPKGDPIIPAMFGIGGLFVLGKAARSYFNPIPSFAADADGFSVLGKKKLGWDEFRNVSVYTVRLWFIPVGRSVIIKKGKNVLGGRFTIQSMHLSAPVKEMVAEIANYARVAKLVAQGQTAGVAALHADVAPSSRTGQLPSAVGSAQVDPFIAKDVEPALVPQASFAQRLSENSTSPVETVPSLSKRLFGRR